jgi:lipopolysaccharide export system protein LptA
MRRDQEFGGGRGGVSAERRCLGLAQSAALCRVAARNWRQAAIGFLLWLVLLAGLGRAQKVGSGTGIKFSDYYDPPHSTQMKWLLEGASAVPLAGGRSFRVNEAKAQTFRESGEGELVVEAPQCVYDSDLRQVNSPGLLHLRTADGSFFLDGEGFSWQQANAVLFVSNRVHTIVHPELASPQTAGTHTNTAARPSPPIEVFSDQFDYSETTGRGVYRGNVRVAGTNLAMSSEIMTVLVAGAERRLQSMISETNVACSYGTIQATAQRATYAVDTGLVHLTGSPTWRDGPREGRGDELVLDQTNRVFRADGHAWLKMPGRSLSTVGVLPQARSPRTSAPPSTNEFAEVLCDSYEIRTNSALFTDQVRVTERRDNQLKGKMDCDKLSLAFTGTNQLQRMVAEDHVIVEQETNRLNCRLLTLTFAGTNDLQRMVAQHDVVIEQATNRFTAGTAVYTATNGLLDLTENPAWRAGQREGKGDRIFVDVQRQEMTVLTNAFMRVPASEFGRSTVFEAGPAPKPGTGKAQFAEVFSRDYTVRPDGALFRGDVRLDHPQMQWTCGQVEALAPRGASKTNHVVAEGAVVFEVTDDKGQKVHGTGDKAVYSYGVSGIVTNETMVLTGNPALLAGTNFTGTNKVFILDLARHGLGAPGKYSFVVQGLGKGGSTNLVLIPDATRMK